MKQKDNEDKCMICKSKTPKMDKYTCGGYACSACLDNLKEQGSKMLNCENCSIRHYITKPIRKPQGRWVHISELTAAEIRKDLPKKSRITNKTSKHKQIQSTKLEFKPFDYTKCITNMKKIQSTKTFQIETINTDKKKPVSMYPIQNDNLLLINGKEYFMINQKNEILRTGRFKQPGKVVCLCTNSKYIYVLSESSSKKNKFFLYQYNNDFELIEEVEFEHECCSLACTEDKVFYSTLCGYEWNPHPNVVVLDAETLDRIDLISNEMESDDEDKYCCEDLAGPPRLETFKNKLYILYPDLDADNKQTLDVVDDEEFHLVKHFEMPSWFMFFKLDNFNGNFINYDFEKDVFFVYNGQSGKLLTKLNLKEKFEKDSVFDFCLTNDGHLVVLRDNTKIEIY
jgi:hypothetical protein